jgi:hypothetical protein
LPVRILHILWTGVVLFGGLYLHPLSKHVWKSGNSNLILVNCAAHRDHPFVVLYIFITVSNRAAQSFHSGMPKSSRVKLPFLIWSKASFSIINARFSSSSLPSLNSADDPQICFIFGMASRMRLSMASVSRCAAVEEIMYAAVEEVWNYHL